MESDKIAGDLIDVLTKLHLAGDASRYKSFLQAIRTVWSSKKIAGIKQRLDEIQRALQFRIQISMRHDQAFMRADILHSLDEISRSIIMAVLQSSNTLIKQHETSNALSAAYHNRIINIISNKRDLCIAPADVLDQLKA